MVSPNQLVGTNVTYIFIWFYGKGAFSSEYSGGIDMYGLTQTEGLSRRCRGQEGIVLVREHLRGTHIALLSYAIEVGVLN